MGDISLIVFQIKLLENTSIVANAFALVFNPLDGKMYHSHPQENYVGSTSILESPKAVCPIEYTQHWNSITFKILSPVFGKNC